jgi:hypothetical protein
MEESSIVNNIDQDDHEEERADLCTPFCVSTSCAIHAFCTPEFYSVSGLQNLVTANSTYTPTVTPLVILSIWQPPKLV